MMCLYVVFLLLRGASLAGLFGRQLGSWGAAVITTSCLFFSLCLFLFGFCVLSLRLFLFGFCVLSLFTSLFTFFETALSSGLVYTQTTMCMDAPHMTLAELVSFLSSNEITQPIASARKLAENVAEFREITQDLNRQFIESRGCLRSGIADFEVQKRIIEELVPERWHSKLERLDDLIGKITRAYLAMQLIRGINPFYVQAMDRHITVLENVRNATVGAKEDLISLQGTMMIVRMEHKALLNNESIPDDIILNMPQLDHLARSIGESVSTLTP